MFNVCDKEKQTKESISSCIAAVGIRASCAQINRRRTAGNYRSQSIRVATTITIIITALLVTNNFHCLFISPLRHPFISMIKRKRSEEKQRERGSVEAHLECSQQSNRICMESGSVTNFKSVCCDQLTFGWRAKLATVMSGKSGSG